MDLVTGTRVAAIAALILCVLGIGVRLRSMLKLPVKKDYSRARGSSSRAVLYAFTLGMAPWEKESTRIHWIAYLRGIIFHVSVFLTFGIFFASFWVAAFPDPIKWAALLVTGIGALAAFAGIWMRYSEPNLHTLSIPDDYAAIFLTGVFITSAFAYLLAPGLVAVFYIAAAILFIYIPFGKIRHCAYFFYSKFFFGWNFGHRGVLGQKSGQYTE